MNDKVFIIGLNKTGTTTLEHALKILGYNVKPYHDNVVIKCHKNPSLHLRVVTKDYNAFQDIPYCTYWKELYELYPNAKFILTVRSDADKWIKSLINHTLKVTADKSNKFNALLTNELTYGYKYPGFHESEFKKQYYEHNLKVRRFFRDKDNFLEFQLSNVDDKWKVLCDFLDKPIPKEEFPYANKSTYYYYDRGKQIAERYPEKFFGYDKDEL